MAEIKYNNLYNQLNPMDKRYYDQQFSKKYVPGQENIMLTSQPAYEQMKAVYEAEQQIPETGFFDSLFGSASAAEQPSVPNLSYQNITPTFDLGTGITNTSAATNMYTPFMSNQEMVNRDLVNEIIEQNKQKIASDFINVQGDITDVDLPYSGIGSMRYKTPRTIADQNRVLGQTFTEEEPSGITKLFQNLRNIYNMIPSPLNLMRSIGDRIEPYQQFSPGTTIRDGIVSVAGVNTPYSAFGGDFYNPRTGLNRFDRAAQRFAKTGSTMDLFASSRTLADFFRKRKEIEAAKQASVPVSSAPTSSGGGGGGSYTPSISPSQAASNRESRRGSQYK